MPHQVTPEERLALDDLNTKCEQEYRYLFYDCREIARSNPDQLKVRGVSTKEQAFLNAVKHAVDSVERLCKAHERRFPT